VRGTLQTARALAEEALNLVQRRQDPEGLMFAHDLLGETFLWAGEAGPALYHWFTEGFDTKDLQEAQALLAELV